MKRLYLSRVHEGVGFSENGHKAWMRGERPKWMWPAGTCLEPTCEHHVEVYCSHFHCNRKLVMFYRKAS